MAAKSGEENDKECDDNKEDSFYNRRKNLFEPLSYFWQTGCCGIIGGGRIGGCGGCGGGGGGDMVGRCIEYGGGQAGKTALRSGCAGQDGWVGQDGGDGRGGGGRDGGDGRRGWGRDGGDSSNYLDGGIEGACGGGFGGGCCGSCGGFGCPAAYEGCEGNDQNTT